MSLLLFAYNEVFSALDAAGGEAGNQVFLNAKEENWVMPTVMGRLEAVEMRTVEMVYSFQALMNTKISVVTMPGAAMGSSTCHREPSTLHPSMRAACSISGEMATKVPRSSQMAKAWLKAALISIRPRILSFRCKVLISWEIPISSTTGENIWLMITKPRKIFFPLNFMRLIA